MQNGYLKPCSSLSGDLISYELSLNSGAAFYSSQSTWSLFPPLLQISKSLQYDRRVVNLCHCVSSKDIMCFSPWMRKRKWEVEVPEVCLQTWKEGVRVLGAIRKAILSPVLPTVRAWNPPWDRGAVCKWRTHFFFFFLSLLLPPCSEPLMQRCIASCWGAGICHNIHHLWCAHLQPALLISLRVSSTEDAG